MEFIEWLKWEDYNCDLCLMKLFYAFIWLFVLMLSFKIVYLYKLNEKCKAVSVKYNGSFIVKSIFTCFIYLTFTFWVCRADMGLDVGDASKLWVLHFTQLLMAFMKRLRNFFLSFDLIFHANSVLTLTSFLIHESDRLPISNNKIILLVKTMIKVDNFTYINFYESKRIISTSAPKI